MIVLMSAIARAAERLRASRSPLEATGDHVSKIPNQTHIYRNLRTLKDVRFGFRRHASIPDRFECVTEDGTVIGEYCTAGNTYRMRDGLSGYTVFDTRAPANEPLMENERGIVP